MRGIRSGSKMTQSTVRAPAPTPGHLPSPPVCWNETKFTRSYFKLQTQTFESISLNCMNLQFIEMVTKSCLPNLFVYDVPLAMFCPKPKCRQCLMPASLVTKYVQWENSWVSAGKVERACCLNEEFP